MTGIVFLAYNLSNIAAGILLALTTLDKWDGESNFFNNIAKYLAPFQVSIGGFIVVLSILNLFSFNLVYTIPSILAGILLLTHVLGKVPSIGDSLKKFSDKIAPFKVVIGLAVFFLGVLSLLGIF